MKGSRQAVLLAAMVLALLAANSNQAAQTPDRTKVEGKQTLPPVFDKPAPENARDLEELQEHVKKVLKKVVPATVGIRLGKAAGSGVIIDSQGHVLTAGHVSGKPGQKCSVILPDGKELEAKTLGQNVGIDSGMIKITAKASFPHLDMGDSSKLKPGQWVLSIGHPGGFKKGRSPVVRLGRILMANSRLIRTDCTLVGGDSGGPLFDMQGRVIGIHSRIGMPITENVHVPVKTYRDYWTRLAKGESWGRGFGRGGGGPRTPPPYIGVRFNRGGEDLKVAEVYKDTPAASAGLEAGDIILTIDHINLQDRDDLAEFISTRKVGDEVILLVQRGEEEVKVRLKLGTRPPD
jgi:serine protease Do